LNQLNRSQGQAVPVSETLWSVLQAARRAAENSQGLVTPTVLNALLSAGYERSFENLEGQQTAGEQTAGGSQSGACATFQEIELDDRNRTVRLPGCASISAASPKAGPRTGHEAPAACDPALWDWAAILPSAVCKQMAKPGPSASTIHVTRGHAGNPQPGALRRGDLRQRLPALAAKRRLEAPSHRSAQRAAQPE
jgi:hypothetical protein